MDTKRDGNTAREGIGAVEPPQELLDLLSKINTLARGASAALRLGNFALAERLTAEMLQAIQRAADLLETAMMQ